MLAYQTKTYEHFFWKFYKEAFKQAVKGFSVLTNIARASS